MIKYIAVIAGILLMCVPDDASILHAILQAGAGMIIFLIGIAAVIESEG